MSSYFGLLCLFLFCLSSVSPTNLTPKKAGEKKVENEEEESGTLDDRINLNFQHGSAVARNPYGGSRSDAYSNGVEVGIRRPGWQDQTLYQKTNSYGTSNAYGRRPPTTYANTHNFLGNGQNRGGANAWFAGGDGIARTDSRTQHIEIPLDPYGTVLFSNLEDKKKKKPNSEQGF